jgi:uncharacterized protein YdaU (DUF1376 family)
MAGMEADEGFVYITVLLRIYETGGPVAETPRTLSRRTGLNDRKVTSALSRLFASNKLVRLTGDLIDAPSTHDELAWQQERQTHQSNAGKSSAAKRANKTEKERELDQGEKSQGNQQNGSTAVQPVFNHLDKEEEYSETTSLHTPRVRKNAWPGNYQEVVWSLYPKKAEKKASIAYLDTLYRADKLPFETITAGIAALSKNLSDPQYAPALHRWLRNERWNDEYQSRSTPPPRQIPKQSAAATFLDIARQADNEIRSPSHEQPIDGEILGPGYGLQATRYPHLTVIERTGADGRELQPEDYPGERRTFG